MMAIRRRGTVELDIDFVRNQFPAFSEPTLSDQAFFENAGGSYVAGKVIDQLERYDRQCRVQPYYANRVSEQAGAAMDASYQRFADWLNVGVDEVHFGPSTTQNTYVLAQAMQEYLQAGDEVIVTNLDHEANIGAWRRLAQRGVKIKEWRCRKSTGALESRDLIELLDGRPKLLAFTHCSNVIGQINPVRKFTNLAHAAGAMVVVDGVGAAAHGLPDVAALGCDIYLFSLYKTFGPHQGAMVVRQATMDKLANQGHFFNDTNPRKRLNPAGPDHAQIAAARGVIDYFEALYARHFDLPLPVETRAEKVRELIQHAERQRLEPLLEYIANHPRLQLLGPATAQHRAPTVSVIPKGQTPQELMSKLAAKGIMCGNGHFYAYRLFEHMNINPSTGALRMSFVHYTSSAEVEALIKALDEALS